MSVGGMGVYWWDGQVSVGGVGSECWWGGGGVLVGWGYISGMGGERWWDGE